jgi:hypothetical protein
MTAFLIERTPIVAWRIGWYFPTPVCLEDEMAHNAFSIGIACPDGQVIAQGEQRWQSISAWQDALPELLAKKERLRKEWAKAEPTP